MVIILDSFNPVAVMLKYMLCGAVLTLMGFF